MKDFPSILRAKRKELEMKQSELAEELGMTTQAISNIELGTIPSFFTIDTIANYFKCSVDELVGREGYQYTPPKKMIEFKDIIYKKIREYDCDINVFAKKIGVSYSTVWGWISGRTYPNLKMLCDMADAIECSVDELMGRKPKERGEKE